MRLPAGFSETLNLVAGLDHEIDVSAVPSMRILSQSNNEVGEVVVRFTTRSEVSHYNYGYAPADARWEVVKTGRIAVSNDGATVLAIDVTSTADSAVAPDTTVSLENIPADSVAVVWEDGTRSLGALGAPSRARRPVGRSTTTAYTYSQRMGVSWI